MSLTVTTKVAVTTQHNKEFDLATGNIPLNDTTDHALTDGTGSGKVDMEFSDSRTLAAGASEELDINGALIDGFGDSVTIAKLKVVKIVNTNVDYSLDVGGAGANALALFADPSDKVTIQPGGTFYVDSPLLGLTVGADDKLKVWNNSTEAITYTVFFGGASA